MTASAYSSRSRAGRFLSRHRCHRGVQGRDQQLLRRVRAFQRRGHHGDPKGRLKRLHGTLFEFFRNEKLNARNLFATTAPSRASGEINMALSLAGDSEEPDVLLRGLAGHTAQRGSDSNSAVPTSAQRRGVFVSPFSTPRQRGRLTQATFGTPFQTVRSRRTGSTAPLWPCSTAIRSNVFTRPAPRPRRTTTAASATMTRRRSV